ncbi:MAG: MATE family efflux transporter [Paramuribaculum sp.]|nr:MATE family efflux transporter [Paramuribaculum sp.]MDE5920743.1 MATE family efflux transporter [Paramuribaculum sp.]
MEHNSPTEGNLDRLATGSIGRLLWHYSLPAVVGMVVTSLYNVIDRIFIGQGVGTEAIAGLAITFPVMNVSAAIGVLIGAGASARVSIMLGASDRRGAQLVLGNSLVLIITNALIYLSIFGIFLDEILTAFGASPTTLPYARDFMTYMLPGMMVMNISFSFNNIMRASGYPARAMLTMFIGAGINVILDPIFIFVFGWGIKGAAIATDIAMTCSMIFVMAHFMRRDSTLRFTRGIYRLRWRIIAGIIGIGAAPSLVNLAGSAINVIVNTSLYTHGSDNAVAASGIFTTYTSLLVMVVVGLCQGMQPILGYNYGAGLYGRLKRCYWLATGAATAIVTAGCVFGLIQPGLIARAFTTDPALIAVTSRALSLSLLAFWVVGFQIVATTFFQSIGKAGKSIFLSLTRQVIFLIPLLLTLPDMLGLDGVWLSFPSSDVLATIVTALMIAFQLRHLRGAEPHIAATGTAE